MRYIYSFLFLLLSSYLSAQQQIRGRVVDEQNQPLAGATLTLMDVEQGKVYLYSQTDSLGTFALMNIKQGKYVLIAAFITYKIDEKPIEVGSTVLGMLSFQLFPETQLLEAISIKAKKQQTITMTAGKAVLNVEQSNLAQSQSAFELLKSLPGVNVNKDGDIRIKGKSGVTVMIDGEPVEMSSSQLKNVLKGTPGTTLQAIEVMNNAPASMDAAGTGGVINLVFKKKVKQGFNGSLNTSISKGSFYNHSQSIDLRYGSEKWNHSMMYAYDYEKSNDRDSTFRRQPMGASGAKIGGDDFYMSQLQKNPNRSKSHLLKLSTDYQLNEKNSLGINLSFNDLRNPTDGYTVTRFGTGEKQDSLLQQTNFLRNNLRNLDYGMKYKHIFNERANLIASAQFNKLKGDGFEDYTIVKSSALDAAIRNSRYRNLYPSTVDRKIFKADYLQELMNDEEKIGKFEAGLKTTLTDIQTSQVSEHRIAEKWQLDPLRNNRFNYHESVHAAYVSSAIKKGAWTMEAGLRGEYTRVTGDVVGEDKSIQQDYFSLFPNALLGYKVSDSYALSLAYSRRIERPDYDKLNPSVRYIDVYTTQQGNPNLKPQFSSSLALNQQFFQFIDLNLGYSAIKNPINSTYLMLDGAKSTYTMLNTGTQHQWEASLSFPIPGIDWWENYQSFYLYNSQFNAQLSNQNFKERANSFGALSYNSFKLPKRFSIELTAWYESGGLYANFRYKPTSEVSLGLSKKMLNDRLTMSIALTDAFYGSKFRAQVLSNTAESTYMLSKWDSRQVKFSLNWSLGKSKKDTFTPTAEDEDALPAGRNKQMSKRARR